MNGYFIEPLELAAVGVSSDLEFTDTKFSELIKPPADVPFTFFVTRLTGITQEHVQDKGSATKVLSDFNRIFNQENIIFVAQNAKYDLSVLRGFPEECKDILQLPFLDTIKLARALLPNQVKFNLDALAEVFGLQVEGRRHRAMPDSVLTAKVFIELVKLANERGVTTMEKIIEISAIKPRKKLRLKQSKISPNQLRLL